MTVAQAHKLTSYILGEYPCHPYLGDSQYFAVSKLGEFRNEYMCAEVTKSHDDNTSKVKFTRSLVFWDYLTILGLALSLPK